MVVPHILNPSIGEAEAANFWGFKAILVYRVSSMTAGAT